MKNLCPLLFMSLVCAMQTSHVIAFPQLSNSCGGTLTNAVSEITYKSSMHANMNERCVWIIHVEDAAIYDLEIWRKSCVKPHEDNLIITTFRHAHNPAHYYPNEFDEMKVDAKVVMITFYTPNNANKDCEGFKLRYVAYDRDGNRPISEMEQPHHFKVTNGSSLSYPENLGMSEYSNGTLATFLFGTDDNLYHEGQINDVCYVKKSLEEESCYDTVTFFKFEINTHWQLMERLCGDVSSQEFKHDDIMLAVFESDWEFVGEGFRFQPSNMICWLFLD